jgi:uncharacterized protein (TIGR02266 family)
MTDEQHPAIPHDERRSAERVSLEVEVSLTSENNFYTGFTSDISAGGLFIATRESLPIGTALSFELKLGSGVVQVNGVVRWVREYSALTEDVPPGVGVQFVNLHPKVAQVVNGFISKRRESIFYDDDEF